MLSMPVLNSLDDEELAKRLLLNHDQSEVLQPEVVQLLLERLEDKGNWGRVDQLEAQVDDLGDHVDSLTSIGETAAERMGDLVTEFEELATTDAQKAAIHKAKQWLNSNDVREWL